jgi:hypothetical protein
MVMNFRSNRLDIMGMKSLDYMRIRKVGDVELSPAHVKGGRKTLKYLFLVSSGSPHGNVDEYQAIARYRRKSTVPIWGYQHPKAEHSQDSHLPKN